MAARQRLNRERRYSLSEKATGVLRDVEKKVEHALTCMWDDLHPWQQDNHYIRRGYRPATFSWTKSFASLSYFHNESVNIYTHLLGAIAFLLVGTYLHRTIPPRYPSSSAADVRAFATFFLSAATCLGMSATYHTMSNHSDPMARFMNKLDYLGIVILIVGSFVPSVYYGFFCDEKLMWTFWTMMFTLGIICAVVTLTPRFGTAPWRPYRAAMFIAMGGSGALPVLHGISLFGFKALDERMGVTWVLVQGALYISGALIYAARVPERLAPGRFDLLGASHQIFHCFVVMAALAHLKSLVTAFDFLHDRGGAAAAQC